MQKLLKNYPFKKLDPLVRLVEGFSVYDGVLGDELGAPHKGIDYVREKDGEYTSFQVFAMHAGDAFQGESDTWGRFVTLRTVINDNLRYDTIYAHLNNINKAIPRLPETREEREVQGAEISAEEQLGVSSTTGNAKVIELHIELHKKDLETREITKVDPYGLNERASQGNYPQPGESLAELEHYWESDTPPFAG